jgi:hypothetical protein
MAKAEERKEARMIPLRDANPSYATPVVNLAIMTACTLMFLYELSLGARLTHFIAQYGLVPVRWARLEAAGRLSFPQGWAPFLSSLFLHAGWMHLIGNMWVLHIFGDNVESYLGHARYALFYLACGVAAGLAQVLAGHASHLPVVGASGAIAGVMGAYLVLFPGARILTLIPLFFIFPLLEIPAFVFLILWFLLQFLSGANSLLQRGDAGGVAWWAHAGGFVCGILLLPLFKIGRGAGRGIARGRGRWGA